MMIKEFGIPLNKDDLLKNNSVKYSVSELLPIRGIQQAVDETRNKVENERALFILSSFDTFFSVLVHGQKLEIIIFLRAFGRITKAVKYLVEDLEELLQVNNCNVMRENYLNATKMLAYLWSSFTLFIDDHFEKDAKNIDYSGKRKKSVKKSDAAEEWDHQRQNALELLYRWLQLPLQKLWNPPIIEDSFLTTLTEICYKILEHAKDARQKDTRNTIFEVLAVLVKNHNQGITCVVRIVQLVRLYDYLAAPLAIGVVQMVQKFGCTGMIREIMREVSHSEPEETDARNISTFLETIGATAPDLMLPVLDKITCYLENESYTMRNCAIGVLCVVILGALTDENLSDEQKDKRDECLHHLEEHILDCNAYVRSKVFQVWQRLCIERAIPLSMQERLLAATVRRLRDKSAIVRKQALQLVRALLEGNPFSAKLNKEKISKDLEQAKAVLKEVQATFVKKSARGDDERMDLLKSKLPDIQEAIRQVLENQENIEEPNEDIDISNIFEEIRQFMLSEKIVNAVMLLKTVIKLLPNCENFDNMSAEDKERCVLLFLSKIFAESEELPVLVDAHKNVSKLVDKENDRLLMKQKEEVKNKKRLVSYFQNSFLFAEEMEKAIPVVENMLFSVTVSDAVEACAVLGVAYQFEIKGADRGIRKALYQVFVRDQSVRDNVALVYKEIYLCENEVVQSSRQKALMTVKKLIELLKSLEPGQSPALAQLIIAWRAKDELNAETLQILWEKFTMKVPETTPDESRAALMLITMAAQAEVGIVIGNLDILIKVGFGPRSKTDLLLARDTCRALLEIKQESLDIEKAPVKYPNDHDIFKNILALLKERYASAEENGYISFATDAINVIYHLANQPDHLAKTVLVDAAEIFNKMKTKEKKSTVILLARFVYIIGHIAIRQLVHLDSVVYKELKRRNALRDKKKGMRNRKTLSRSILSSTDSTPSSASVTRRNKELSTIEDNGEEALEGASADDADADFINAALENEILSENGFLTQFIPLIVNICQNPEKYNDEKLQTYCVLALSKLMTISSFCCESNLQLFVTILERSCYPGIRGNVLIGLTDLVTRFPNEVEPWTNHIYGRLRDESDHVRSTCVRMLSNLIMREMIRVKGRVSELALSIVDPNPNIRNSAKVFFIELSQKGNALYNVMPDILSRLSDPELNLEESRFQEILKFILGLLQKERQIDTIIEKICARFKLATTERQWRDLSYCLSLLQFNAKSIRRLIQGLPLLKEKVHNKQVLKALNSIIETTKKKPDAKASCIELEEKINDLLKTEENKNAEPISDCETMPPPPAPPLHKMKKAKQKSNTDKDDSSDGEYETPSKSGLSRNRSKSNASSTTPSPRPKRTKQDSSESSKPTRKMPNRKSKPNKRYS